MSNIIENQTIISLYFIDLKCYLQNISKHHEYGDLVTVAKEFYKLCQLLNSRALG
jgi:hypothetical protein